MCSCSLGFGNLSGRILPTFFQLGDCFRRAIATRFAGFSFSNGAATLAVDVKEIFQHLARIQAALTQFFLDPREIVANEVEIKHGS